MSARGEAMAATRRLDSQLKRERVAAAVKARLASGQDVSIAAIARHASVSRKFIYAHPDLRAHLEQQARRHGARAAAQATADGRVSVASLRADLANAKAHNQRLRLRLRSLEQRLSETLGQDVADELDPGITQSSESRSEFESAQAQIFELTESLADAREELDAVREINREHFVAAPDVGAGASGPSGPCVPPALPLRQALHLLERGQQRPEHRRRPILIVEQDALPRRRVLEGAGRRVPSGAGRAVHRGRRHIRGLPPYSQRPAAN